MNEAHEMILEKTYSSGAEEWNCPTCGRRLLMDYRPKFKKKVLEAGDENAIHSGGKGGLRIGLTKESADDDKLSRGRTFISDEDPSLAPWVAWLDESDFDSLWNSPD